MGTWKSTNATGAPYVLCIFNFMNPGHLIKTVRKWHHGIADYTYESTINKV